MNNTSLHNYYILKFDSNTVLFSKLEFSKLWRCVPHVNPSISLLLHILLCSTMVWDTLGKTKSQWKAHPIVLLSRQPVILSRKVIQPTLQGYLLKTQLPAFTEQYILLSLLP